MMRCSCQRHCLASQKSNPGEGMGVCVRIVTKPIAECHIRTVEYCNEVYRRNCRNDGKQRETTDSKYFPGNRKMFFIENFPQNRTQN